MAMVVTSVMTSCEENGTNTLPPVEDFRVDVALNITCENEGCSSATQFANENIYEATPKSLNITFGSAFFNYRPLLVLLPPIPRWVCGVIGSEGLGKRQPKSFGYTLAIRRVGTVAVPDMALLDK